MFVQERETAELDQARKQLQLSLHHQKALETEIRKLQIQVHSSPSEEQVQ